MKRILIMVMSCNQDFFIEEEKIIKDTWAKPIIDKKYDNIDFIIYRGDSQRNTYEKSNNLLLINCEDDLPSTYKKTYLAFKLANKIFQYDYIFRTNTSTYINVELLNEFVQTLIDDDHVWGGELYSLVECKCPDPCDLYLRGSSVIYPKKLIDRIITDGITLKYLELNDDWAIGNILNSYWIKNNIDYTEYVKSYPHGWYKCIDGEYDNGNTICLYGNINKDFNFLNRFISIQVKNYSSREDESKKFYEINEVFENNSYTNINDIIKTIYLYSVNPNIFLGENLKYISLSSWKDMSKSKIYNLEFSTRRYEIDKINLMNRPKLI